VLKLHECVYLHFTINYNHLPTAITDLSVDNSKLKLALKRYLLQNYFYSYIINYDINFIQIISYISYIAYTYFNQVLLLVTVATL
jgi:hypothetical protein